MKTIIKTLAVSISLFGAVNAHALHGCFGAYNDGSAFGTSAGGGCVYTDAGGWNIGGANNGGLTSAYSVSPLNSTASLLNSTISASTSSGYANAILWDTLTFQGLPANGAMVTETLSLSGSNTPTLYGYAAVYSGNQQSYASFDGSIGRALPGSVSYSFLAYNGQPVNVSAELDVSGGHATGAFSILAPAGSSFSTASGITPAVPEPSTYALMGLGLLGLAYARRRRMI